MFAEMLNNPVKFFNSIFIAILAPVNHCQTKSPANHIY